MRKSLLSQTERNVFELTCNFLDGRLKERVVILWAANLAEAQVAEREAIDTLLFRAKRLDEPYRTAWAAVIEHWKRPAAESEHDRHLLRLAEAPLGGDQVKVIVDAVRPFLTVEDPDRYAAFYRRKKRRGAPQIGDLIDIGISSGDIFTPTDLGLAKVDDTVFLVELAKSLDAALFVGLALAERFSSTGGRQFTSFRVRRVYFVEPNGENGENDPDRHSQGFAPCTKLLYAVVARLAEMAPDIASGLAASWRTNDMPLYRRLWAAWARNGRNVSSDEVFAFLEGLTDDEFWDRNHRPELAELRAVRWSSLAPVQRSAIEKRLKKGPSAKSISTRLDKAERAEQKKRRSLVEFRRIEAAGGVLSIAVKTWVEQTAGAMAEPPPILETVTGDFVRGPYVVSEPLPDGADFGELPTAERASALFDALLRDDGFDGDAHGAARYIGNHPEAALPLIDRAEGNPDRLRAVWKAVGYYVRPADLNVSRDEAGEEIVRSLPVAEAILARIVGLDVDTARGVIEPLTYWMDSWDRLLGKSADFLPAIRALWPLAAAAVNESDSDATLRDAVYSSPVGQLMTALVHALPPRADPVIFAAAPWNEVLGELAAVDGEARRQMRYRLLGLSGYFHHADPAWAAANLFVPLRDAKGEDIALWGGFAEAGIPRPEVFDILGASLVDAVGDAAVDESDRRALADMAVWSDIHARVSGADVVPLSAASVQQMLRVGGPEVRAAAASSMEDFLSGRLQGKVDVDRAFEIFRSTFAAVWPKERTLNAALVSKELAGLPATAPGRYAEAAEIVMPYLVPFDCWSLHDYGVYEGPFGEKVIGKVESKDDAKAFLAVLDATVGESDQAVIPRGLDRALTYVAHKDARLENDRRFQRLLTLSRRQG